MKVPYHSITVALKVDTFEESNKTNATFLKKQHQNLKEFRMVVIPDQYLLSIRDQLNIDVFGN